MARTLEKSQGHVRGSDSNARFNGPRERGRGEKGFLRLPYPVSVVTGSFFDELIIQFQGTLARVGMRDEAFVFLGTENPKQDVQKVGRRCFLIPGNMNN